MLINQNFKIMFKSTFCSYLQIIITVCPKKIIRYSNLILDLSMFSVYGHGAGHISRLNFSNLASTGFHICNLLNSVLKFKCFKIHEYDLLRIIDCYIRELVIYGFNLMIEREKAMYFTQK